MLDLTSFFDVSAKGETDESDSYDLQGKDSVPVALAPAYIISPFKRLNNGTTEYRVASLDPGQVANDIRVAALEQDAQQTQFENLMRMLTPKPFILSTAKFAEQLTSKDTALKAAEFKESTSFQTAVDWDKELASHESQGGNM